MTWIMSGQFEGESVTDYFMKSSSKNVDIVFRYLVKHKADYPGIYFPSEEDPEFHEKLILNLSCISQKWDTGLFKRVENPEISQTEVLNAATIGLPATHLYSM